MKAAIANWGAFLVGVMLVAGCAPSPLADRFNASNAVAPDTSNFAVAVPDAPAPKAIAVDETTDVLEYKYSYPAAAAAIPDVASRLNDDAARAKASALKMAGEDQTAAGKNGYPYRRHASQTRWTVKADTPRFLSLIGEIYFYTGGAHGNTGYKALIWDKPADHESGVIATAASPEALNTAISQRFCDALNKARAEKRGEPVVPGEDSFTRCVDPLKQALVFGSADGKAIDTLLIVIGPYEAGALCRG